MRRLAKLFCLVACAVAPMWANATEYPLTVTDMAGRQVTIPSEPKHVVIQDGRDVMALAVLDRENPFKRVIAWNNLLKRSDMGTWDQLAKQWPESRKILDMKFSDGGDVNIETVLSKQPDLVIAQLRAKPAFEQDGVLRRMKQVNVPVLFVDTGVHPVKNAAASVALLGKVLNKEDNAKEYDAFYQQHLAKVQSIVKKAQAEGAKAPTVFFEAHAGARGANDCCFTHSTFGWGGLVKAAGGDNLGLQLLNGPTGVIAMEKVLALQPDIYMMSGAQWSSSKSLGIPFGYKATEEQIQTAFSELLARPGFDQLKAVKNHRVYGVYHQFYNHPYNIIGIEILTKIFYPQAAADLDPVADYNALLSNFTQIDGKGFALFAQAK